MSATGFSDVQAQRLVDALDAVTRPPEAVPDLLAEVWSWWLQGEQEVPQILRLLADRLEADTRHPTLLGIVNTGDELQATLDCDLGAAPLPHPAQEQQT